MKAVDITQIIQVAGPFIVQLVELLLRYFSHKPDDELAHQAITMLMHTGDLVLFEDENGTRFSWPTTPIEQGRLAGFIQGIIAAKRQAGG